METIKRSHRAHFQTSFEAIRSFSSAVTLLSTVFTHRFMLSCSVALASPTRVPHIKWLHSVLWGPETKGAANPSIVFRGKSQGQVWAALLYAVVLEAISIVLISHLHGLSTRTAGQQLSIGASFSKVIVFVSARAMVPWP